MGVVAGGGADELDEGPQNDNEPDGEEGAEASPPLMFAIPRLLQPQRFFQVDFGHRVVRVEFDGFAEFGDGFV